VFAGESGQDLRLHAGSILAGESGQDLRLHASMRRALGLACASKH